MRMLLPAWGERVRRARHRAGLSQARLAELVGVRQQSISKVERGAVALNDPLKIVLAVALDADLGSLFPWPASTGHRMGKEAQPH